jgi:hypothetical protein
MSDFWSGFFLCAVLTLVMFAVGCWVGYCAWELKDWLSRKLKREGEKLNS